MGQDLRAKLERLFNDEKSLASTLYQIFMALLVGIVCIDFVLQTYPIPQMLRATLEWLDFIITWIFLLDYVLRWWVVGFSWRYPFSLMAIIDLVAILPLFFMNLHWQFIRVLRVFRILRLLRILRRREFLGFEIREVHQRLLTIFFTIFCIIFISSGLIYDIEGPNNPDFETFFDALWFSVISITTVGYGDITPITTEGRVVTLLVIGVGIVLLPWQLTNLLQHIVQRQTRLPTPCGSCGLRIHEQDANYCKACGNKLPLSNLT